MTQTDNNGDTIESTPVHHEPDRLTALHDDIRSLRESVDYNIRDLTAAITKLVKIEERQTYQMRAYNAVILRAEKAETKFDLLEARVDTLEKDAPLQRTISKWILSAVWTICFAAVGGLLKLLGIY